MESALSVVIVAWNSGPDLSRSLPAIGRELGPGDELIVVDNGSDGSAAPLLAEHVPDARLEVPSENLGFAAGANLGAGLARNPVILLLNPDAVPLPGFGSAIRRPAVDRPEWDAWMGLVACRVDDEPQVNSWGNPVHYTGIAWAGGHGRPLGEAGPDREVPTASGACMAIRREAWRHAGGFSPPFFLYQEDVDLSLRIRASGGRIGLAAEAVVEHDYEFSASPEKWFWLERNRLAMLVRNYPSSLLLALAPVLLLTELAILSLAVRDGWTGRKVRAWRDFVRWLPRLLRERRAIRRGRTISPAAFARILTPELDSEMFPDAVRGGPVGWLLVAWWRVVGFLIR